MQYIPGCRAGSDRLRDKNCDEQWQAVFTQHSKVSKPLALESKTQILSFKGLTMREVWIYVVRASSDPDRIVGCHVPWRVDDELIFFGPCKKLIRKKLRKRYLLPEQKNHATVTEDLIIVNVNGANPGRIRKMYKRFRSIFLAFFFICRKNKSATCFAYSLCRSTTSSEYAQLLRGRNHH